MSAALLIQEEPYNLFIPNQWHINRFATLRVRDAEARLQICRRGKEVSLWSFDVQPAVYRNQGLGTQLMKAVLTRLSEEGVHEAWLTVEKTNHAAIRLYKRIGFTITEHSSRDYIAKVKLSDYSAEK